MADGLLNAFWRGLLSQTANATTEVAKNEDEVCRRLILSGITVSAAGVISIPGLTIGTITVPGGGTGVTSLTSHGVLVGEGVSNVAVTAAGTTGQVLTGVTGADPTFQSVLSGGLANTGTTTTVLHGNAAGTPAYGAIVNADITNATIDLTTKVTGVLPVANGGTNGLLPVANGGTALASGTSGGVLAYTAAGTLASSAALAANALVKGGGAGVVPATDANWTINSSNILSSATQPRARVFHSALQSIPDSTFTTLLFDSEDFDVGAMHSTVSNTSRLTIPTGGDGLYLLTGLVGFGANGTGQRNVRILKNGAAVGSQTVLPATGGSPMFFALTVLDNAVATDFYELSVFQSSTAALNVGSGTRSDENQFSIVKLW